MMEWLIPAYAAALAGTLLLALVFYYLHLQYRHTYFRVWAAAWTVYGFRFVAELIGSLTGLTLIATIACQAVTLFSGILLLFGTYAYLSRPLPQAWLAAGGIGLLWLPVAGVLGAGWQLLIGPTAIVVAAAYAWTGRAILRSPNIEGIGKGVAGWAFLAWSVLKLAYPVWGTRAACAEWGFLASAVLVIAVAVGFLLMYFERTRTELLQSSEQLRQLAQNMPVMLEQELRTRAHQQETVALLGQMALAGGDSSALLKEAVHAIARVLAVEFCEVLELLPEEGRLIFRAGLSDIEHLIDRATVDAGTGSQAGYTLLSREPVIMADIDTEVRFSPHHLMHEHGIVSGMSVVIGGKERPFGVLNASTTRRRTFSKDDTHFLQSVANVLAAAIERKQAEEALRRQEQASRKLARKESVMSEIGRVASSTLNIEEVYGQFAAEVKKILPFDRIAINLVDVPSQTVTCQYVAGLAAEGRMPGDRFDLAGTATAACVESGRGMLIPAFPLQELAARFPGHMPVRQAGVQTTLLAPLVSKGRAFGALVIMSTDANQYTERDIPLAENVAAQISGAIAHARLFAEHRQLEQRLRQAQKMEAIGTLAGGIAHDFNNILAAIIGFGELARIDSSANAEVTASISEILKASFRARDLVRQILTFSRQTEAEFIPIQAHIVVKEAVKLMRASLPSTIQVKQNIASQALVMGDPTQIHQVVMNLCTNAYHAMREEGGELVVDLSEALVDESLQPELQDVNPGRYLKLSVRDTGHGIEPGLIHRIFDPYFTTKEKAKGTGLGLAVVHGIVKGHKGAIQVSSRLGAGTTFNVYFPIVDNAVEKAAPEKEAAAAGGSERILFVDDEPAIETMGQQLLGRLGYEVVTCANGEDALSLFRSDPDRFDIVITDMTMPGMTGDRMAVEMMRLRPDLPVIVCTGFNERISTERAQAIGVRALLMKPFLKNEAAEVIREVLDRR
jgi:signal transduction histidine kinase/CheY-like chemotaxis protein